MTFYRFEFIRKDNYDVRTSLDLPSFIQRTALSMFDPIYQNGFRISVNSLRSDEVLYLCHSFENLESCVYVSDNYPGMLIIMPNGNVSQPVKKNMTKDVFKKAIRREKFLIREAKKNGDDLCCSICLEKFKSCTMVAKTSCNHRFHVNCLKKYFCTHGATCCPICRTKQEAV